MSRAATTLRLLRVEEAGARLRDDFGLVEAIATISKLEERRTRPAR
jgi:hypothetical protein